MSMHTLDTPAVLARHEHCRVWDDLSKDDWNQCILPLITTSHKGSSGRIGVLGGNERYTGAPYYAAKAALLTGADLATVFTAEEAALPIKCYSPELMVQPVYTVSYIQKNRHTLMGERKKPVMLRSMVNAVSEGMDQRLHCLIIGPGMGRCPVVMEAVAEIIRVARDRNLYLVLDADALFLLAQPQYRDLLQGYDRAVITPNSVEYQRLVEAARDNVASDPLATVTIVQKGAVDHIIRDGTVGMSCHEEGGMKRAGGIGDVLAGAIGTMIAWQSMIQQNGQSSPSSDEMDVAESSVDLTLACWAACCLVKRATKKAFVAKQRAMSASDILDQLGVTLQEMTSP